MQEVITWTVACGSLVFVVGLISAFEARRLSKSRPRASKLPTQIVVREPAEYSSRKSNEQASMAAGGTINATREEELASIGSSTR
jgi:hypothetical protein